MNHIYKVRKERRSHRKVEWRKMWEGKERGEERLKER